MNFRSKTALAEHIKDLVNNHYLTEHWKIESPGKTVRAIKYYKVNFRAVKK